jgi:(p)ppGpp synthase/HD superfamily hydrolase
MTQERFSLQQWIQTLEPESGRPLSPRILATLRLASEGHDGQFRQGREGTAPIPYMVHPVQVARLAIRYFPQTESFLPDTCETLVCAALAHDLLEDTEVDTATLAATAGDRVAHLVEALTRPPEENPHLKTPENHHQEYAAQVLADGPAAVYLKLCDSIQNLSCPDKTPPALYQKTLRKVRKYYLPLLDACPLGDTFKHAYLEALQHADQKCHNEKASPEPSGKI